MTNNTGGLKTITDILDWIKKVELMACDLYQGVAERFSHDEPFSSFLTRLAKDESRHVRLIEDAKQHWVESKEYFQITIMIDTDTREQVETPIQACLDSLMNQTMNKKDVLECIVRVEFSEWNRIFLYMINAVKHVSKDFQRAAAMIQEHEKRIENFVANLPLDPSLKVFLPSLPPVWENRILVVEDDETTRDLLADAMNRMGNVETASNGREALASTREHYYSLIVSDIQMPEMDGLTFFKKAAASEPDIRHRILFCSGGITPKIEVFFKKQGIPYLEKPFDLAKLLNAVREIMTHNPSQDQ